MGAIISGIVHQVLKAALRIVWYKIGSTTLLVGSFLVLSLYMFVADTLNHAQANKHVDAGISIGSHVWCDESHIVGKQVSLVEGHPREAEGVYVYFDVTRPSEAVTIDLKTYGRIKGVHPHQVPFCHNHEIIFSTFPGVPREQIYHLFIGEQTAELLAEVAYGGDPSQMFVDSARYMLAGAKPTNIGLINDRLPTVQNCGMTYIKSGYRVVCVDQLQAGNHAFPKGVLDNWPLLRDPDYQIIANLLDDPDYKIPHDVGTQRIDISPDGTYLYSECQKDSSSRDIRYCRYRLDGHKNRWEEMFLFRSKLHDWNILAGHSPGIVYATNSGDVFFTPWRYIFIFEGMDSMWRWSTESHAFLRIPRQEPFAPWSFSPSGKRMSFSDQEYHLALYDLMN